LSAFDIFSLVSSIASIILAIVAIVLAILSDRRAAAIYLKTLEALQQIDRRAAVTESTVGTQFQQMMTIVKTVTTDKEIQKAEVIAKGMEGQTQTQKQLFGILQEVIQSGDKEKVESFVRIFVSCPGSYAFES
jgi:hypothetical protein